LAAHPLPLPGRAAPTTRRSAWEIQKAVVLALFIRELRARVEGRWLGLLWTVAEPVAHLSIIMTLFIVVRHVVRPGIDPALFLATGLVPFFLFRNLSLRNADSVRQNFGLFSYRQVKPFDTLLSRTLVEIALSSLAYAVVLAALGWWGIEVWPAKPLELFAASAVLIALGFGLGLSLMVACTDRPRLRTVVGLMFVPLYLLSGVIFPLNSVPNEWLDWLLLNPLVHLVDLMRQGFAAGYPPLPGAGLAYPTAWALGLLALGLCLYRVERRRLIAST
jgi:capsular polysaccharide transport system permease protein